MCSLKFIALFLCGATVYSAFLFVSGSELEVRLEFYPL